MASALGALPTWVDSAQVKVVIIYLREAHSDTAWPIGTPPAYAVAKDHENIQERVRVACELGNVLPPLAHIPIYADDMQVREYIHKTFLPSCLLHLH